MKARSLSQAQLRVLGLLKAGNRVIALDPTAEQYTTKHCAYVERPGMPHLWITKATIMSLRARRHIVHVQNATPPPRFEYKLREET